MNTKPEPTDDEADLEMFSCEPEGLYKIPVGAHMQPPYMQRAFMRAVLADHLRLISIEPGLMPVGPGRTKQVMFQVYYRTMMGNMRMSQLRAGARTHLVVDKGETK